MSSIDDTFRQLRGAGKRALVPFVTAGDPDLEMTRDLLVELGRRGAAIAEVGIPYSDPIADGPVIQASYTRALAHKIKLAQILEMLRATTATLPMPVVTMVSYAIVYRHGLEKYVREAKAAGVAGAIVPDLLVEESAELSAICRAHDFSLIQLITPTTPRERAIKIAQSSTGFIYYVSVTGITGERTELPRDLVENVSWLRTKTELPICIGFGISRPEHVRRLAPVADGLIVGSAIVRQLEPADGRSRAETVQRVGDLATELLAAFPQ